MSTIFTVGYEGTDIDRFVDTLLAVGIEAVADVRAVPISRKKGFSKNVLKLRLESVGIAYVSAQELGDPKPGREAARSGNISAFKEIYTDHIDQPSQSDAVGRLADCAKDRTVCLLCFERDPNICHRLIVAERLEAHGFGVFHLFADDPERYRRHREKLPAAGVNAS